MPNQAIGTGWGTAQKTALCLIWFLSAGAPALQGSTVPSVPAAAGQQASSQPSTAPPTAEALPPSPQTSGPDHGVEASAESASTKVGEAKEQASSTPKPAGRRRWHVRLGTVTVAAAYAHTSSGFFYGLPFYAPLADDLFALNAWDYSPGPCCFEPDAPAGGALDFRDGPDKGRVELVTERKDAEVYIDDDYVGLAGREKSLWLAPGAYDLTVSVPDGSSFHQRLYVLSGKTVKVRIKIAAQDHLGPSEEK